MTKTTKSTQTQTKKTTKPKVSTVKMSEVDIDQSIHERMPTDTPMDRLLTGSGIPKAANYIMISEPGLGKTINAINVLADLHQQGYKTLYISAEMNRIDMDEYCHSFNKFRNINILFLADYIDEDPVSVIEEVLKEGWDVVAIDSVAEVEDTIRNATRMKRNSINKWLLDTIASHNEGKALTKSGNGVKKQKTNAYTTFFMIQQMTKGGKFVGSNRLKHMTTGMIRLQRDENEDPYMILDKNRRGPVNKKLYFSIENEYAQKSGNVFYDTERLEQDEKAESFSNDESKKLEQESKEFDKIFQAS